MASRAGVPSRLVAGLRPTAPRNTLATPKPAALAEGAVDKKDAPEQGGLRWADALRWCRKVSALDARGLARRGDWRRLLRRLDAREDGAPECVELAGAGAPRAPQFPFDAFDCAFGSKADSKFGDGAAKEAPEQAFFLSRKKRGYRVQFRTPSFTSVAENRRP
jgi:hypothetical protein